MIYNFVLIYNAHHYLVSTIHIDEHRAYGEKLIIVN